MIVWSTTRLSIVMTMVYLLMHFNAENVTDVFKQIGIKFAKASLESK